jgi:hypothetical protein
MPARLIPFTPAIRPPLPTVVGSVDYRQMRDQFQRIDQLLRASGIEERFVVQSVEKWQNNRQRVLVEAQVKQQLHARRALRCNIARNLLRDGFRPFAVRLADSPLLQDFCGLSEIDRVVVPAKSTLQRYAHWTDQETLDGIIRDLLAQAHEQPRLLRLEEAVDLETCFLDTTCLKANIHYPVDWVLFRDATRTLIKAIALIRAQRLRHRMEEPSSFLTRMNRLCIEMAHAPKRIDSKRHRKKVLRKMDRLVRSVRDHAKRYRNLLDSNCQRTEWTRPQAEVVLRRIDGILALLPAARKQALQRILHEQPVPNEAKVLSLYEPDVRVILRNKVSAPVEFGNTLLLGESKQGLIVDWALFEKTAPQDARLVPDRIDHIEKTLNIDLKALSADRAFDSAGNQQHLAKRRIYNGICPRDPRQMKGRMASWKFAGLQRRRSQTEGRISILLHNFLGQPTSCKGFAHRQLAVSWGVLTHNLWLLARLPQIRPKRAAA